MRAEHLQAVEKLNGFGVGHAKSQHELDGDFFRQPVFGFSRPAVAPRHIFLDAPEHDLQFNLWRARVKPRRHGKF
jgi:hypothetical protein